MDGCLTSNDVTTTAIVSDFRTLEYKKNQLRIKSKQSRLFSVAKIHLLASFPGLFRFYVLLIHAKHVREKKFEKRDRPGTISHARQT